MPITPSLTTETIPNFSRLYVDIQGMEGLEVQKHYYYYVHWLYGILLPDILTGWEMKENITDASLEASLSTILPIAKLTEICILIGIKIIEFN